MINDADATGLFYDELEFKIYCIFKQYFFKQNQTGAGMLDVQNIHPSLWRASQLAASHRATINTGWAGLNQQLPGQGWPCGAITELCLPQPGVGELRLLRPALALCPPRQQIVLINCPFIPNAQCWANWSLLQKHPLLWVNTQSLSNTLWAAEQTLRHDACAALLCWLPKGVTSKHLRRLGIAAQGTQALCFLFNRLHQLQQPSPVPLRIGLQPAPQGLQLHIAKRQGPACHTPVMVALTDLPRLSATALRPAHVVSHALYQPVFH